MPMMNIGEQAEMREADALTAAIGVKKDAAHKPNVVTIRPKISDVQEMLELINDFASANLMLYRGPQYLYENIRDYILAIDKDVIVRQGENGDPIHLIVACGSLHVLWHDFAEIRSLAIHSDYHHLGFGSSIVRQLIEEAKQLGIKRVFTFTMTEPFFKSLGFKKIQQKDLPPKLWGECSRCPKYFKCDEVGMVLDI